MGKVCGIKKERRIHSTLQADPYLFDHQVEDVAVFPAVAAMEFLAHHVVNSVHHVVNSAHHVVNSAHHEVKWNGSVKKILLSSIALQRFLIIDRELSSMDLFCHLSMDETRKDCEIKAALLTHHHNKKMSISRFKEHVTACIHLNSVNEKIPLFTPDYNKGDDWITISSSAIYDELVLFGPAFQNIKDEMHLGPNGAVASVFSGVKGKENTSVLGSLFSLDAVFHAACVWGQRYLGVVTFPVYIEKREIYRPTEWNKTYTGIVKPLLCSSTHLVCNIIICDEKGMIYESVSGVHMKDVTRGRLKPPGWILNE